MFSGCFKRSKPIEFHHTKWIYCQINKLRDTIVTLLSKLDEHYRYNECICDFVPMIYRMNEKLLWYGLSNLFLSYDCSSPMPLSRSATQLFGFGQWDKYIHSSNSSHVGFVRFVLYLSFFSFECAICCRCDCCCDCFFPVTTRMRDLSQKVVFWDKNHFCLGQNEKKVSLFCYHVS